MISLHLASKTEISPICICNDAMDHGSDFLCVVSSLCIFVKIFYKTKEILIYVIAVAPYLNYYPASLSSVC